MQSLNEKQQSALNSGNNQYLNVLLDEFAKKHNGDRIPIFPALSKTHGQFKSYPMSSSRYNALLGEAGARYISWYNWSP
jgi:hypothetical protein